MCGIPKSVSHSFYFFCLYVLNTEKDSLLAVPKSWEQDLFPLAPGSNCNISMRQVFLNKLFLLIFFLLPLGYISLLLTMLVVMIFLSPKTTWGLDMKLCFDWSQWQCILWIPQGQDFTFVLWDGIIAATWNFFFVPQLILILYLIECFLATFFFVWE